MKNPSKNAAKRPKNWKMLQEVSDITMLCQIIYKGRSNYFLSTKKLCIVKSSGHSLSTRDFTCITSNIKQHSFKLTKAVSLKNVAEGFHEVSKTWLGQTIFFPLQNTIGVSSSYLEYLVLCLCSQLAQCCYSSFNLVYSGSLSILWS